jgi:hypothetical protein
MSGIWPGALAPGWDWTPASAPLKGTTAAANTTITVATIKIERFFMGSSSLLVG